MNDLVAFVRARLDKDRSLAQQALDTPASDVELYATWPRQRVPFGMTFDPARVLREVEAKRRVIELHQPDRPLPDDWYGNDAKCKECGQLWHLIKGSSQPSVPRGCRTLRLLAAPYADHEEFDDAWRV